MADLSPVPASRHGSKNVFLSKELDSCSHVFLRIYCVKPPLKSPYSGPHAVVSRTDKTFTIIVGNRYLILAALISYVPCITLLTKLRKKYIKDGEEPIKMSPSFWFVYAAFIKQGTTLAPEANTTRLLFATWWIFIILLSSFYTANLTAFLTLSKFTLEIKNAEDLYKKNYRWVTEEGGAIQYIINDPEEDLFYLSRMVSTGRAEFRPFVEDRAFLPLVLVYPEEDLFYLSRMVSTGRAEFRPFVEDRAFLPLPEEDLFYLSRMVSTGRAEFRPFVEDRAFLPFPEEDLFYLSRMVSTGRAEFRPFVEDRAFLPLVLAGAVLVKEQIAIDHLMYTDYQMKTRDGIEEADRCTYVVAPEAFIRLPRAFAFPKDSNLPALFDPLLVYLLQAGIISFLQVRDLPSTKMCPLDLQSKDRKLRNGDLMMTYIIMGVGLAIAAAVFVAEIFITRYFHIKLKKDHIPRKETTKRRKSKSKKTRFKAQDDDSRPPPYDSLFGINSRYTQSMSHKTKIINGREYYVMNVANGETRLVPVRTPSALLYR
ncbi:ligand-gated ion channel domain-containing protein [Phthorimaea operculella]|nr:ligand-gated ion channel domain-containing protein [Phthorimaea operculella]